MAMENTTIPFDDFRDQLGPIFDAITQEPRPVYVERSGVLYRLEPQLHAPPLQLADPQDIWRNYDPEKVKEAFHRGAGLLRGVAIEELLRDIHEQREQHSQGRAAE